jgi:hypothetical protein
MTNFIISILLPVLMKKRGGECRAHGGYKNGIKEFNREILQEENQFGDLDINRRTILK